MTVTLVPAASVVGASGSDRFRLHRAGVLNVWQYDEQVFEFADGRLLLRGANGAGKSKTLEMLLPFALDGDKARITASGKHHTSLLWLMTEGVEGGNRVGYVWVEFGRTTAEGALQSYTCGVGIRASSSARSATAWHFATDRRIGVDLDLEDGAGPLGVARLKQVLGDERVFEKAADYKAHVGRTLFGLDPRAYDEVLRLLYWLRQPQVGEDIEPAKLAQQLSQALPQLDEQAIRTAGDTFDELRAFGEQIDRRHAAGQALGALADAYAGYARAVLAHRAGDVTTALREERQRRAYVARTESALAEATATTEQAEALRAEHEALAAQDAARLRALEESPESRDQRRLSELAELSDQHEALRDEAQERLEVQQRSAARLAEKRARRTRDVQQSLAEHVIALRELDGRQREAVPGSFLAMPVALDEPDLGEDGSRLDVLGAALNYCLEGVVRARSDVSRRAAAVRVVREAVAAADEAARVQQQAERAAERAEARWEEARAARTQAEHIAGAEQQALATSLRDWAGSLSDAPDVDLPAELTEPVVAELPGRARSAAARVLTELREARTSHAAQARGATHEIDRLRREREKVAAEREPSPPQPPLPRTSRPDGRALWQVVDFAAGVDDAARAGLEAALQASGLLDAWVRPGGVLLDADHLDVVLAPAEVPEAAESGRLDEVLQPDLPAECGVSVGDVRRILRAVGMGEDAVGPAWVAADGRWRLGPAHGRATKAQPQYVGASARAAERARRLARLDEALAEQQALRVHAETALAAMDSRIADLEAWADRVPRGQDLVRAWVVLGEREAAEQREEAHNRQAQREAHEARAAAAAARTVVREQAATYDLPADHAGLDSLDQRLRALDDDLGERARHDRQVRRELEAWRESLSEWAEAESAATEALARAGEATRRASERRAEFETLQQSVGDSVRELQRAVAEVSRSKAEHDLAARAAERAASDGRERRGAAQADLTNAQHGLREHLDVRRRAVEALVQVTRVPGLLDAADVSPDEAGVLLGLVGHPSDLPVARSSSAVVVDLAGRSSEPESTAAARVWRAHSDASTGPAADHQVTIAHFADLLAVTGRDDRGEDTIVVLASRTAAAVEHDRALLTDREKQQFEQHVLGELGDAIRRCRRDAQELVTAMNEQLATVSTSQGIRTRLEWRLRDDVPAEARAAVELLAQPVGALVPEERETLRDVLHRLIEASRSEHPDLSYGEHLAAALDYRTWSEFSIRYNRPEKPGQWDRLHRRSPLSQGEQKVLCYLPLFAAAAAHFTSLAGAAPHAPRLVLLDDAFPKIDVRTHPLLFGLLVQLDLDFVITSERLWGDHPTVPALAIYEALRDPGQRGIAQYEYRWDGRVLQALG